DVFQRRASDLLLSALLLGRYAPGAQWVDGAYWSLLVEVKFYFWIGLVFLAGATRFSRAWAGFVLTGLAIWALATAMQSPAVLLVAREVFVVDYMPFFTAGIFFFKLLEDRERP